MIFGIIFIIISNVFALYPAEFVREAFDTVLEEKKQISSDISSVLLKVWFSYCSICNNERSFYVFHETNNNCNESQNRI